MDFKSIFKHYWKFVKKYPWSQVAILVSYGFGVLGTVVVVPLIYKRIIDIISSGPPQAHEQLSAIVLLLAAVVVGYNIFFRIADYYMINLQSKIIKELHDYSLEKLQKHSYAFFSNAFVGGLVAKTKRFVHAFETLHDQFVFQIWMNGITLISSLAVLWLHSRVLGLAFLSWIVLYGVLVCFMVRWQIPKSIANAEADTKTTSHYADIITNILTIKMFATNSRELKNFEDVTDEQENKRRSAWMQESFWNGMFQAATIGIFNIAIIWFAVDLWKNGIISAGTIVLVQAYVLTSFNVVWSISRNIVRSSAALSDADEMVKIFDKEPSVKDPENPEKLVISKGRIEFKKVSFSYDHSNNVFKKLDIAIESGEKVALVGHSGAGKTTIVKILLRFAETQEGTIEIDGQNICRITQDELRRQIAYVPQDPSLFHRSLRDNIGYAKEKASFFEIISVAKKAQAHEFINSLPKGYDSLVGERGIKLSGGERQRIAIARAMLKNSPIVVLDEATSSLDSLAEEKIQKALEELMKDKTTIAIAHRLSTIKKMDRIIVFDQGEVAETGTHGSLLRKNSIYAKLWKSQVGGFVAG